MSGHPSVLKYEDAALILIDYQKEMFAQVRSETSPELIDLNVRLLIKVARAFGVPIVLSTVGVQMGVNGPTRESILAELPDVPVIDRSSMNAWEDEVFRAAVKKTGRKRLIFGALWTEICLAFPVIDALKEGYDVTFVVDAGRRNVPGRPHDGYPAARGGGCSSANCGGHRRRALPRLEVTRRRPRTRDPEALFKRPSEAHVRTL